MRLGEEMKTKCYCAYCTKHPLYGKTKDIKVPTGFGTNSFVNGEVGVEVDCLKPIAEILDYELDAENYEYPVTAYGDGIAVTVFDVRGQALMANCENEDYDGEKQF